ncbi:MAG: heparinase II/III domain-containing protein [Planctomycetota bacterium]|jgi:hypothetical protein
MMLGGLVCLFTALAVCLLAAVDYPLERIEVPEEFPPHPRVLLNQGEIDALRAAAEDVEWLGEYVKQLTDDCKKLVAEPPTLPGDGEEENKTLGEHAANLAMAYVLTDRQEFARLTADILRSYIEVFPTYPITLTKGRATSAALSEAGWAIHMASAYDLVYNSGELSDEDKAGIEANVLKLCGEVMRICNHRFRSNWRNRAMSGFGVIGFCIEDREMIDEALNGFRDEDGTLLRDGFAHHLSFALLTDGTYYERSNGYHGFSQLNYTHLMEAARHNGVDLWHLEVPGHEMDAGADQERAFGDTGMKTIRPIFEMPFYNAFSDYSLAAVSNASKHPLGEGRVLFYEAAYKVFGDPKYAWIANRCEREKPDHALDLAWMDPYLPAGEFSFEPDTTIGLTGRHENLCTFLPSGGFSILRQSADETAAGVLMTYGKYGSGHSHPDKLGIVFDAAGKQIMPEVKYGGYSGDGFLGWTNQTIGHSTVTVDEMAQHPQRDQDSGWVADTADHPVRGRPVMFHAGEKLKTTRADCTSAYDGVLLDRTIVLVDSVVVDFFRCRSEEEHLYDFALHVDGKLADAAPALGDEEPGPLADKLGYSFITNLRRAQLNGEPGELAFSVEDTPDLKLSLMPTEAAELVVANAMEGPEGEQTMIVVVRAKGTSRDFVSTIRTADADCVACLRPTDLPEGVLGVEVARADGAKDIVLSAEASQTFTYAGCEITGQVALLRVSSDGTTELVDTAV